MTPEFDNYTISRVLGEGGMGVVYLAKDRRTGESAAVKVISSHEVDPDPRAPLPDAAEALTELAHRNVVRCREITRTRDGAIAVVTDYVAGADFRAFEGRPYPELLPLMVQAVQGLAYLRRRDVVHGDLSSNNFLVTLVGGNRVAKVVDLGFARIFRPESADGASKSHAGQFVGKFAFSSPEHFFPSDIDWRSDVYSVGVVFHRLLAGRPPITVGRESRYFDWMVAHEKERVFDVETPPGAPPLPEELRDLVRRMLARNRDARPQSYEEVLEVLDRVSRGIPPALEPDPGSLETLPPPVEGRMSSSGGAKRAPGSSPVLRAHPAAAEAPRPASVESSQQKRWPDLEVPEPHTERFVSFSPSPSHAIPADAPPFDTDAPPFDTGAPPPARDADATSSSTELLSSPVLPEPAQKTAPTVVPERAWSASEVSLWAGGTATEPPAEPVRETPGPADEKTERLDDVIEKLRQRSSVELLPPLTKVPPNPEPASPAPPSRSTAAPPMPTAPTMPTVPSAPTAPRAPAYTPPPSPPQAAARTHEPPPVPVRPEARPARAPSKPGQRLVVYGGARPAVPAPRPAPAPAPAPPAVPAPAAADRRLGRIGIGLIVAAIVVLFAVVLWVLVTVVRGASPGAPRRSGALDRGAPVAAVSGKPL